MLPKIRLVENIIAFEAGKPGPEARVYSLAVGSIGTIVGMEGINWIVEFEYRGKIARVKVTSPTHYERLIENKRRSS